MASIKEKFEFITGIFGKTVLGRDGINVSVKCPSCKDQSSKKKLVIRLDDERYHCWVCDIKGRNLYSLLKKYHPAKLAEYQRRFSKNKLHEHSLEKNEEQTTAINPPKDFLLLAKNLSSRDPDIRECIKYVFARGLSLRDMWYFKLGTCSSGRFRRRVIIPSFDDEGQLNYYVARSIDSDTKMKYINARVPKKNVIFNQINIKWNQELVIVEGPFDLMKCDENATCLLGSSLTERYALFQEIVKHGTRVLLALDPDASKKTHNFAKRLSSYGIDVRMITEWKFSDVGEMSQKDFLDVKKTAPVWRDSDRLYDLISSIKSGSLF